MDLMVDGARAIVFHLTTTWKKKKEFISINHIWVSRESRETNKITFWSSAVPAIDSGTV
jgi:hypothetical protein